MKSNQLDGHVEQHFWCRPISLVRFRFLIESKSRIDRNRRQNLNRILLIITYFHFHCPTVIVAGWSFIFGRDDVSHGVFDRLLRIQVRDEMRIRVPVDGQTVHLDELVNQLDRFLVNSRYPIFIRCL